MLFFEEGGGQHLKWVPEDGEHWGILVDLRLVEARDQS